MTKFTSPPIALLALLTTAGACDQAADPPEPLFTLAIITDPHITGSADHEARLATVVAAVNDAIADRDIELVAVLGDIGWNGQLGTAKQLLDQLAVPYVPIIGDNEFHGGDEEAFATTFAPVYSELATTLSGWHAQASPVANPETGNDSWFQNFGFDFQGVHFIAADWCARVPGTGDLGGDLGFLHDFEGGTLPWFEAELAGLAAAEPESVVILSHIPMHEGAFPVDRWEIVAEKMTPYSDQVWANLAGHAHVHYGVAGDDFDVWVTAATWSSYEPVRMVSVAHHGDGFVYTQELLYIPF